MALSLVARTRGALLAYAEPPDIDTCIGYSDPVKSYTAASRTIMRSTFQRFSALLVVTQLTSLAGCVGLPMRRSVDLLVAGGTVYNGAMVEPAVTDVGVIGDKIVFI